MGHLVITIGCEYGAKGNAIGRKIAEDLGIKFYDRELVDQIIEEVGMTVPSFHQTANCSQSFFSAFLMHS